jgi:hypothetical protein
MNMRSVTHSQAALPTNHLSICIGIGTAGVKEIEILRARVPEMADLALACDGEISKQDAAKRDYLIAVEDAPVDDFLASRYEVPFIATDSLFDRVSFPHSTERAAGTCRSIGVLKMAGVFDEIKRKAGVALTKRLARFTTQERPIIDVNFITASGGGFGSGNLVPLTLLMRDLIRNLVPLARTYVHVHLILANNYERLIADPATRNKIKANELATYLELNAVQDPAKAASLYALLDCERGRYATFDSVIPYSVVDAGGHASTLDDLLGNRVLPNIMAFEDEALAKRMRELGANNNARLGVGKRTAQPFVSVCQASILAVPQQLGACWAVWETLDSLKAILTKPSPDRLKGFLPSMAAALGLPAMYNDAMRLGENELANLLTSAASLKDATGESVAASLSAAFERYDTTARPTIDRKSRELVSHYLSNVLSRTVAGLIDALTDGGARLHDMVSLLRSARQSVDQRIEQVRREMEETTLAEKKANEAYQGAREKLRGKTVPARVKEEAGDQLNDRIRMSVEIGRFRAVIAMLKALAEALGKMEQDATLMHSAGFKAHASLEKRFKRLRELVTFQSPTLTSVIAYEALDGTLKRIGDGVRNTAATMPTLDVKAIIRGRHLAVADQVMAHVEMMEGVFNAYFEAYLTDVTGTIESLGLNCSVREWLEKNIRSVSCCSPVQLVNAPPPQTLVVACGADMATLNEVDRSGEFTQLDVVTGSNPRTIIVYRRVNNLTIEAIPTFADAKRAASPFPRPGTALIAWDTLESKSEFVADGAFAVPGLVPASWLESAKNEPPLEGGQPHQDGNRFAHSSTLGTNGDRFGIGV